MAARALCVAADGRGRGLVCGRATCGWKREGDRGRQLGGVAEGGEACQCRCGWQLRLLLQLVCRFARKRVCASVLPLLLLLCLWREARVLCLVCASVLTLLLLLFLWREARVLCLVCARILLLLLLLFVARRALATGG